MITINKDYFSDKPDYPWLMEKLAPSFELTVGDVSKIVYGFNGLGKSSFSKCLKAHNESNNFMFLDYETESQKYSGNSIKISPYIFDIEKVNGEIAAREVSADFGTLAKKQGFVKTSASKGPQFLKAYVKNLPTGKFAVNMKLSDSDYVKFASNHSTTSPQVFYKLAKDLESVSASKTEIENYEKDKWRELLLKVKEHVDDPNTCPVCDTGGVDINEVIAKKVAALSLSKSSLIKSMEENSVPCDEKTIDAYLNLFSDLSTNADLLNDYVVCGTDVSKHQELSLLNSEIKKKKVVLSTLTAKRDEKYNQIKARENRFKKDVARYLKVSETSVAFDDVAREITITMDRDTKTYSTGERHILWFLVEMYSFLGSDCPVLVLDDPASSLDLTNLYKIAFEIIRNSSAVDKTLLVFTHSFDLINAINSQFPGKMGIYYLEEYKGELYCDEIKPINKTIANVIDTQHFAEMSPKIYESLRRRDYEGASSLEHSVYHYSPVVSPSAIDPENLSNEILCEKIDSYSGLGKTNFYEDAFQKVLLLISLRVWVERALFRLIPESDETRRKDFLSSQTLQSKLDVISNSKHEYSGDLFALNNIEKEDIACKKVMLNQNSHYYSQVMPFAYAINLSIDDIDREIREIKKIFKS